MANRPHTPTESTRTMVKCLKVGGYTDEAIASAFDPPINNKTLRKHYATELASGKAKIDSLVVSKLVEAAIKGDITAAIFYLKTRMGWRETPKEHLHDAKAGGDLASFLASAMKK